MFGALNRLISRLDSEPVPQSINPSAGDSSYGFQVLKNVNPDLPLEPWFDFIIGINGHYIEQPDAALFATEIQNCAGGFCSLDLWSSKGQRTHSMTVPIPAAPQSLGLSLQLAPLSSTQNIWHILTIPSPLSPAHLAGLLPHSDYILGSPSGTLRGESALGELVEDHLNRSLVLWVYNSEFDVVREVELIPRRGWGGEGALGAILGYGALHRLPVGIGEEVQGPGEKLFDADRKSAEYTQNGLDGNFLPTEATPPLPTFSPPPMLHPAVSPPPMMSPGASLPASGLTPSAASRSRKARHHGTTSPNAAFEDMFAEGAKKSAERDFVPSRKGTPLPPPPKIGEAPVTPHSVPEEKTDPLEQEQHTGDIGEPGDAEAA